MTLVFMGLPQVEISSDFKSASIYAGYGFWTSYFITGNIGPEFRIAKNQTLIGPKASLGWVFIGEPGVQFTMSTFAPISKNGVDVIINPKIGTNVILGIFYLEAGYNFNTTRRLDIPNSVNLTLGVHFPLNIEKFINAV